MNLPNFFLADLPPDAPLTVRLISEACQTLKQNRTRYLVERSTESMIDMLSEVAAQWLQPDDPLRQMAIEQGPPAMGFSEASLQRGLDCFFSQITPRNLQRLVVQELGHGRRLDDLAATNDDELGQRAAMAHGPEFLAHIAAGNLPNPTLLSIVLGLLVRSAQFVKCASGASWLPRLFAHSIYRIEPKIGACLEIVEWPGGNPLLEEALFAEADCVTATGTDETLAAIRLRLPRKARFLGYGHRLSFGYITRKAVSGFAARQIVAHAAGDVAAWNQLGCLSPHVFYVEHGGANQAEQFAAQLAEALAQRETIEPRGPVPVQDSAAIASRRSFYRTRATFLPETQLWCSPESTAWTVLYEPDPRFQTSCLNRFIYVKSVASLSEALHAADEVRGQVSTVGLAATQAESKPLALQLARWGVPRVCPLGQMQNPPLTWRHDGRPSLADLVTWTDWEQ
jgi:hypothetical protein